MTVTRKKKSSSKSSKSTPESRSPNSFASRAKAKALKDSYPSPKERKSKSKKKKKKSSSPERPGTSVDLNDLNRVLRQRMVTQEPGVVPSKKRTTVNQRATSPSIWDLGGHGDGQGDGGFKPVGISDGGDISPQRTASPPPFVEDDDEVRKSNNDKHICIQLLIEAAISRDLLPGL